MQTVEGARKAQATIKARYGLTPDGKSRLAVLIGAKGGFKSRGGGFQANYELAQMAGRAGGRGAGKKYQCTECGKEFSEHFIDYHMESKHPVPQTEVAQQLAQIESKSSWVDRLRFWQ